MGSRAYEETVSWLYGLEAKLGMDFRLQRLAPALADLSEPQRGLAAIHVAGTNGKGSTAAMLHAVYTEAGYRVGLYTSPHLLSYRERIRVGRTLIDEERVVHWVARVRAAMERCRVTLTFFEITTLAALLEFRDRGVDLAVVETGLGGRLDATNVVEPVVAIITSVAHDHGQYLGDTLAKIAFEKAGVIKSGVPVVTGPLPAEAEAVVAEKVTGTGSPWLHFGRDFGPWQGGGRPLALVGAHQRVNAAVVVAVTGLLAERFPVSPQAVDRALGTTRWPGRLELLRPAVSAAERLGSGAAEAAGPAILVDGAHNVQAVEALRAALSASALPRPWILVFGVMADKDWREMLCRLVPAFDEVVLVPVAEARGLDPTVARTLVEGIRPCHVAESAEVGLGVARRRAGIRGSVVVTGSIFLVAELYRACGGVDEPFEGDAG